MSRRWLWSLLLLGVSVALSVLLTLYFRSPFLMFFLFLPFLPFLFGSRSERETSSIRECPTCGYATDDPLASFCPRDATPLRNMA